MREYQISESLETKRTVLDAIKNSVDLFKRKSPVQYVIRCPICGDSQSDPNDAHCYIKCSNDPDEPLLYNCFRCGEGDKVNKWFLTKLGIDSSISDRVENQRYNRVMSVKKADVNIITGTPIMGSPQMKYIEHRLGPGFTIDDYDRFKIIWNLDNVYPYISDPRIRNTLPSNHSSIYLLSDNRSMLLVRSFEKDAVWRKINLFNSDTKAVYVIKSTVDLFTEDVITINIAEGVFDILSVYKNFNTDNSIFIANLGINYISGVDYAIAKGFMGSNVIVKLYLDSNVDVDKLKYRIKKYKWLFKKIHMYVNIRYKDVGVRREQIELIEYTV